MKKLFVIMGVLAFSASASADSELISSMEGYYRSQSGTQTKGEFIRHWEGAGLDCSASGNTVLCVADGGIGVLSSFTPRLNLVGVLSSTGCKELRSTALRLYKTPTTNDGDGLIVWVKGTITRAFVRKGVLFDNLCALTIRDSD